MNIEYLPIFYGSLFLYNTFTNQIFLANLRKEENISVTINLTRFISYEVVVRQSIYL